MAEFIDPERRHVRGEPRRPHLSALLVAPLFFTGKIAVTGHATSEPSASVRLPPTDGMIVGWPTSTVRPSWMNS